MEFLSPGLKPNPDYRCTWEMSATLMVDQVRPDKLEVVVASFCYLGNMLSVGGGYELVVFRELLPVLTSRHLSYKTRGHVYSSCVWIATLHDSETWPLTKTNLQGND